MKNTKLTKWKEKLNSHNRAEAKGFQESEVGRVRKTRPENPIIDHGEVQRRHEYLFPIPVGIVRIGRRLMLLQSIGDKGFRKLVCRQDLSVGVIQFHYFGAKNLNSEGEQNKTEIQYNVEERFRESSVARIYLMRLLCLDPLYIGV